MSARLSADPGGCGGIAVLTVCLASRVPPAGGAGTRRLRRQLIARPPAQEGSQISSARDRSLSFTFLPGEVTHPLTTWVDCGVEEGERAEVGITGVAAPNRYAGRVFADPAVHEVDVDNLTPVPAVPAAAAVLLGRSSRGSGRSGGAGSRRPARSSSPVSSPFRPPPAPSTRLPKRPRWPTVRPMPSAPARLGGGRKAALSRRRCSSTARPRSGLKPSQPRTRRARCSSSDPPGEVQFFDPTGTGTFVVIPAGRTTAAVYTWVDCDIREGDIVRAGVVATRPQDPGIDRSRVRHEGVFHPVVAGDLVPVPSMPTSASLGLAVLLAVLGGRRLFRRPAAGGASRPDSGPALKASAAARRRRRPLGEPRSRRPSANALRQLVIRQQRRS